VTLKIYQVDAFTNTLFRGNPAAICPLEVWLPDHVMQAIAAENNLAETGFYVRNGEGFTIRWFTPETEVDLCGHATLAAAYVVFTYGMYKRDEIRFDSRSGPLAVRKKGEYLELDFPADVISQVPLPGEILAGLGAKPVETYRGKSDYMLVYSSRKAVAGIIPDFLTLNRVKCRGIIVTAPGDTVDFVSRFFAPQSGIPEDPVTGSAHTTLTPYWSGRLGKTSLTAEQISKRGGSLRCTLVGDRVLIAGEAVPYLVGAIEIPETY
jgi:PhzF family phenazine biosynthesis protein